MPSQHPDGITYYTTDDLAAVLEIKPDSVLKIIRRGLLRVTKTELVKSEGSRAARRTHFFSEAEVTRYLQKRFGDK